MFMIGILTDCICTGFVFAIVRSILLFWYHSTELEPLNHAVLVTYSLGHEGFCIYSV